MTPSSPTQLKRALIARLEDVQKRLQEAGQLGESLVRQQRELQDKIKEVETEAANGGEISPALRQKLTALEKEYNEVHKESTRALLSSKIHGGLESPHKVCPRVILRCSVVTHCSLAFAPRIKPPISRL